MADPRSNPYGNPNVDFVGALGDIGDAIGRYRQRSAVNDALTSATGPDGQVDFGAAMAGALRAGDLKTAAALGSMADRQFNQQTDARNFAFREKEAGRAQSNADRSFGLQQQQFTESQRQHDRDFDLKQREFNGEKRPAGFEPATVAGPYSEGAGDYTGQGPFVGQPGLRPIPGGPTDPVYIEQAAKAKLGGADALLDEDTLKQLATQYRAGDTSVMQNLGRGAQGAENVVRLRREITRQNAEKGETGTEQAARNAEFFGTKAGQRTLGGREANIELAATEFKQVIPVVQAASTKVDRTRFPDLNRIIQSGQMRTGDPAIVAFGGGVNTLVNLYARAVSPTGTPTVSDKDHAREILSKAWSQGQFDAAVGMMQQEIDAALASPAKVREEMRKRFAPDVGSKATPAEKPTPMPTFTTPQDAYAAMRAGKLKSGDQFMTPDGEIRTAK